MKRIKKSPKIVLTNVSFNLGVTINTMASIVVKNINKRSVGMEPGFETFSEG